MMVPRQVLSYIESLSMEDHAVLFYESLDEKNLVLFNFVKAGLDKGEDVLYVTWRKKTRERVRQAMKNFGIDIEKHEREGHLEVRQYDPRRLMEIVTSPSAGKDWLKAEYKARDRKMRVVGDIWLQEITPERMMELEMTFGRKLDIPVALVCAYPSKQVNEIWEGDFLIDLIKAHGHAIFPGIALNLLV